MQSLKPLLLLLPFLLFLVPAFAVKKSYIVYLGSHSHGLEFTDADLERATTSHHEFLGSFLGSHENAREAIFYSYQRHINGFAAELEEEVAGEIAKHPGVVSVFQSQGRKLQTTRSWDFMMMGKDGGVNPGSLWEKGRFGEDMIIANLDSGDWPESKSFSDEDMRSVPKRWKGACDQNPTDKIAFPCNKKLIGTRFFYKGYQKELGLKNMVTTPRNTQGHGTHTLSTAGGNFVPGVSIYGNGNGTAAGGSPKARVASYKVCWPPTDGIECMDPDILAGFDMAINDGVDVISVSLAGFSMEFFEDAIAIGSWHAAKRGITVVCAAGNQGPHLQTVSNTAPWIITVAASTIDRSFEATLRLKNGQQFNGTSLSPSLPDDKDYPLITGDQAKLANASDSQPLECIPGTLDPKKVKGKILVCLRGGAGRVEKGREALRAGAVGMVLCNDKHNNDDVDADPHFLPAVHLTYSDGVKVFSYVNSDKNPLGSLPPHKTKLGVKPAPKLATFSSRGPDVISPEILKPDLTAPGVDIIAAYSEAVSPSGLSNDSRTVPYYMLSGTSMACPHVSGVVGLLRTMHPTWSSAAIRSALMTTATPKDNAGEEILNLAYEEENAMGYGAGHIRPNLAMDPGLVYDLSLNDYLDFLCARGYNQTMMRTFSDPPYNCSKAASNPINVLNLNYPSIAVPKLCGAVTVHRRVKNVGSAPATYVAKVVSPPGYTVSVKPWLLRFNRVGKERSFTVTIKSNFVPRHGDYVFGSVTWRDGKHYVRSPIAVAHALSS